MEENYHISPSLGARTFDWKDEHFIRKSGCIYTRLNTSYKI
jgi:hypothetical protein